MKVRSESTANPTCADRRMPAVADSGSNVWYHRRLRAGGVRTNSRKSYVPPLLFCPNAELDAISFADSEPEG